MTGVDPNSFMNEIGNQMKEKTLSDRINNQDFKGDKEVDYSFVYTKDIKQAIKRLKEESKANEDFLIISIKKFNKIFGDKLT